MPNLNKVMLMGRLTADPELRRIASGTAVTEVRMAVNKQWKTKDGEKREDVLFADVTFWDRKAEVIFQYFQKGSQIYIEGSLKTETWDDKTTGEKRSKMKIVGDDFQFLDSKPKEGNGGGGYQGQGRQQAPQQQSRGPAPQGRGGPTQGQGPARNDYPNASSDDDIPFARPTSFDDNEFWSDPVHGCADDKAML